MSRLRRDRRGVSVTVGYVLMLIVATLIMGTLLTATSGLVEGQSEQVIDEELTVIGNQLAGNLNEVDQLAQVAREDANTTGGPVTVRRTAQLPDTVAGTGYLIEIDPGTITLSTTNPDVEVTVSYPEPDADIASASRLAGGDVQIVYDYSADELEVDR